MDSRTSQDVTTTTPSTSATTTIIHSSVGLGSKRVSIDDSKKYLGHGQALGQERNPGSYRDVEANTDMGAAPQQTSSLNLTAPIPLDGGKTAWLTILGCWMVQFCTIGYSNAFGVYQDFYTREFLSNKSPSDISWIGSFALFMQYVPGVFVGHAFDAGYFHHMMALGSFFQVFSMFMLSLARQEQYYQIFFAQAVGIGLGMSLIFIPSLTIISHHFRKRRAFVTGMAVTGASFGGIVWPIMLNQLIQVTSFANAVRSTGAVAGVMLLVANLIMKPTKEVKPLNSGLWKSRNAHGKGEEKQRQKAEGERGARQQDQDKNAGDGKRTGKGLRPGCESSQSQRGKSKTLSMISNVSISGFKMGFGTGSGLKDILNDAPFVVSIAAACLVALGLFFPYFYLQLYAVDLGIDPTLAFYALPILNASSIAGRLLPNFFADKIGPFNMIIPCLTATSILLFSFFGVRDFAAVVVMGILYGFTSGSYLSLIPSIIGQLSKYSTQPGLRMGFAFTNVGVWMLVGAPIEGALLHPDPSTPGLFYWSRCIVFSAVMVICGALGMFLSRTLFVKAKRNGEKGQFI